MTWMGIGSALIAASAAAGVLGVAWLIGDWRTLRHRLTRMESHGQST